MAGIIIVGAQWGDEGKGKIIDVFSAKADCVVRFQGGANAGHTLVVNGQKHVFHLIPSGILHEKCECIIASGVVVDLEVLAQEVKLLQQAGILNDNHRLMVSESCTVLLPYHKQLDGARELSASENQKIGTTKRGIGPAYEDRASRHAITFGDLFDPAILREKLEKNVSEKNMLFAQLYNESPVDLEAISQQISQWSEILAPYRCADTSLVIHNALKGGKKVLFEGAQGTLLDLVHGTYPFVTSSSTIAGSACTGAGVGPRAIAKVIGLTKAYATRVGSGPFPTELHDEFGQHLHQKGHEYGATTGRPRRCGWLDLVALRYAIRVNGVDSLTLTKLDVLSGLPTIKVCVGYKYKGQELREMPLRAEALTKVEPIYRDLPGWSEDLTQVTNLKDLPRNAREFVHFIGHEVGTPVDVISVGPDRLQTLWIKPLFA